MTSRVWIIATAFVGFACNHVVAGPNDDFFEKRVRPILVAKCIKCHGDQDPEAQLKLTSRAAILRGGESGRAAVPSKPMSSLLLKAVLRVGDLKMPPDKKLLASEVATLRKWIELGMPWPKKNPSLAPRTKFSITPADRRHWSFQPVKLPQIPTVRDVNWCRTPVDRFILNRLENANLKPAAETDRRTLMRRLCYDLTGLPPTAQAVQRFLSDQSPNAYQRVVERLLSSPEYGVRWGRHWLDVVRYCDSRDARHTGQPYDTNEAWRYRDWVVQALNRDMPYDEFVKLQIAGDCISKHNSGSFGGLIASGLLVIGEWGSGDADARKMYTDIVDDQIHVVSQAFLSLSITCARCHDHKFDPISTEDYYALAGIFFSTQIATPRTDAPLMRRPLATANRISQRHGQKKKLDKLKTEEKELRRKIIVQFIPQTKHYLLALCEFESTTNNASLAVIAKRRKLNPAILAHWHRIYLGRTHRVVGGPLLNRPVPNFTVKGVFAWKSDQQQPLFLINTNSKTVQVPGTIPARSVAVHPRPASGVGVAWRSPAEMKVRIAGRVAGAHDCGDGIEWSLELVQDQSAKQVTGGSLSATGKQSIRVANEISVNRGDVLRLAVFPKRNHACDLTTIELVITETEGKQRSWDLAEDVSTNPQQGNPHQDQYGNSVWHFISFSARRTAKPIPSPAADRLPLWAQVVQQAKTIKSLAKLTKQIQSIQDSLQRQTTTSDLRRFLLSKQSPYSVSRADPSSGLVQQLKRNRAEQLRFAKLLADAPPNTLAAKEGGVPNTIHAGFKDARVHIRGSYRRLGKVVPRRMPMVFGKGKVSITGSGRIQLADWIASKENPLTARVMVNRIWLHHFGQGLVRTAGDFGRRGLPPTHPKLLDYLAHRFVQSNWSIKDLHRLLVLSSTYRQSSRADRASHQHDPENKLLSRMAIRRLAFEEIRDTVLAASETLDLRAGGPSIPRYPRGYSRAEFNPPSYASNRRTLYLMSIRSEKTNGPFVLDAADPDRIVHQRPVTTTAPQALFILNNKAVRANVAAFARRVTQSASTDKDRIRSAYRFLFARAPTSVEMVLSHRFLERFKAHKPVKDGLSVWEAYSHALFCTNEMIYLD